jgi:hypothetical protein
VGGLPDAGLSDREIYKRRDTLEFELAIVPQALARGDITVIKEEMDELLYAFQLNVDRKSASYRKLGMAVLAAHVRALMDIERRNNGEPVRRCPHDAFGADIAAGARSVLNDERLPESLQQRLAHKPRDGVGCLAGRKRDDDAHRPRRIGLCPSEARGGRERGSARSQMQERAAGKVHWRPPP